MILFCVLVNLSLVGCAGNQPQSDSTLLIPLPPNPIDPTDAQARTAIKEFLSSTGSPAASLYDIRRYDLNGDGRREAVVFIKSPFRFWCGTHGCTVLVFKAHDKHFTLVNDIQPVRAPIHVSANKTNGWHDLIVRVSGRWTESHDVALRFDGRRYPTNPESAPIDPYLASVSAKKAGVRLFYE